MNDYTIGQDLDQALEMQDLKLFNHKKWIDEIRKDIKRLASRIWALEKIRDLIIDDVLNLYKIVERTPLYGWKSSEEKNP